MKKSKVWIACLILLAMMFSNFAMAAEKEGITYTALGDSIAFGIGAMPPEFTGYTDLFNDHLTRIYGTGTYCNLSVPGKTSSELLADLQTGNYDLLLESSQKITISIGGNDLLEPLLNIVELVDHPAVIEGLLTLPPDLWPGLFETYSPANAPLVAAEIGTLYFNLSIFESNWLDIISYIRGLNFNAQIFVNTVYNPFENYPLLHAATDELLPFINMPIEGYAEWFAYDVVDVYAKFEEYDNPSKLTTHNLPSLEELGSIGLPIPTDLPYLHPTDRGYKFIFNMHKDFLMGE